MVVFSRGIFESVCVGHFESRAHDCECNMLTMFKAIQQKQQAQQASLILYGDTMRISGLLTLFIHVFLIVDNVHAHSFRAIPADATAARRSLQLGPIQKEWPYAFFVSYFEEGDAWCITAKNGFSNGDPLGFDLCDFDNPQDDQLFLLNEDGKIHTKLDPFKCFTVEDGEEELRDGHSYLRFGSCLDIVKYNTFTHNRGDTGMLRVQNDSKFCIKQTGNGPDRTDSLRTFVCDEADHLGMFFDYREYKCSTRLADVDCCDDSDCSGGAACENYECTGCSSDVDCCTDDDCPNDGEICQENVCVADSRAPTQPPLSRCNTDTFGVECCADADCPNDFNCESNTCVSPAFFLVSDYEENQDWCASASNGLFVFAEVAFEPCKFRFPTGAQLWHRDTLGRFRSNLDLTRCMTVDIEKNIFSGLGIHMASCMLNLFRYDNDTDQIHLGEDVDYCLTSSNEDVEGRMSGKPCKNTRGFGFELKVA